MRLGAQYRQRGTECAGAFPQRTAGRKLDMFTTVFIGSSTTQEISGRMVTPRGYEKKCEWLIFSGTTEGRALSAETAAMVLKRWYVLPRNTEKRFRNT